MKIQSVRAFVPGLCLLFLVFAFACVEDESRSTSPGAMVEGAVDEAGLREILAIPNRMDRVERLVAALRALPPENVEALHDILRDRDDPFRGLERVLLVATWAQHDPEAATAWALRGERGDMRDRTVADAVREWARRDPEAVIQAYDVPARSENVPSLLVGLIEGWFQSENATHLEDYVRDLGKTDARQRAVSTLARLRLDRDGAEAVVRWAESIPEVHSSFREVVYQRAASEIAKREPLVAARWCERVCDGPYGDNMTQMVVRGWAEDDGAAAMDWLLTRPDEQETWVAARVAFRQFMISDEDGALEWIEAIGEDLRRNNVLQGPVGMYVSKRSWRQPEIAIEWTEYLEDEEERELALISIARRWLQRDEAAAEQWLAQSPLSEEARQEAYEIPNRFRGRRMVQ